MIDHVSLAVSNLARARTAYLAALTPLGFAITDDRPAAVGFGKRYPELWINLRQDMAPVTEGSGAHVCLRARSAAIVDAVHGAALDAGWTCDGPPGLRPHARVRYYAAFMRDADGNRLEVVTFLADTPDGA